MSKFKKEYTLYNRYNYKVRLIQINNNEYALDTGNSNYTRHIYTEDNKGILAVDPEGGPFLSVGFTIDKDTVIEKINNDYTFILKKI